MLQIGTTLIEWLHEDGFLRTNLFKHFHSSKEKSVANFLNSVGEAVEHAFAVRRSEQNYPRMRRSWSSKYSDTIVPGSPIHRKPDIVLLDKAWDPTMSLTDTPYHESWLDVKALGEVTASNTYHRRLKNTVDAKTYIMFLTQHDRTFVPVLSFFGTYCMLTITDRESQIFSRVLRLKDGRHEDVADFLRILIPLMFGDDSLLGLDTTMTRKKNNEIDTITVGDETYEVVRLLYGVQSLLGRGTKVWEVKKGNKYYVLKDGWILPQRPSEADTLKALAGIPGVPTFIAGGTVIDKMLSVPLTTGLIRKYPDGPVVNTRERRRVVEEPKVDPLSYFPSKLGLCTAFRDIVKSEFQSRSHIAGF